MPSPLRFKTISQFHGFRNLPLPKHPLISVIDASASQLVSNDEPASLVFDFFAIALKSVATAQVKYGQQSYDFDSGMLSFSSPGQVISPFYRRR